MAARAKHIFGDSLVGRACGIQASVDIFTLTPWQDLRTALAPSRVPFTEQMEAKLKSFIENGIQQATVPVAPPAVGAAAAGSSSPRELAPAQAAPAEAGAQDLGLAARIRAARKRV